MDFVFWIASWSRVRVGGARNLFPSEEAKTSHCLSAIRRGRETGLIPANIADAMPGKIIGMIKAQLTFVYSILEPLSCDEREQYTFWRQFLQDSRAHCNYLKYGLPSNFLVFVSKG
jgi:hypothetical protein